MAARGSARWREEAQAARRRGEVEGVVRAFRRANWREVRALITHFPYLLPLTDASGFTALHHATLSRDPRFTKQLLELYHDPKHLMRKRVKYQNEEELRGDNLFLAYSEAPGALRACSHSSSRTSLASGSTTSSCSASTAPVYTSRNTSRCSSAVRSARSVVPKSRCSSACSSRSTFSVFGGGPCGRACGGVCEGVRAGSRAPARSGRYDDRGVAGVVHERQVIVEQVVPGSLVSLSGVVAGDTLSRVDGMDRDELLSVVQGGPLDGGSFPVTLHFSGAASDDILSREGWTPLHSAAGNGPPCAEVLSVLLQERGASLTSFDAHGCTALDWELFSKSDGRPRSALRTRSRRCAKPCWPTSSDSSAPPAPSIL